MQFPTFPIAVLLVMAVFCVELTPTYGQAVQPGLVLTKIDATQSTGLCLCLKQRKIVLENISGYVATSFPIDSSSLVIVPVVSVRSKAVNRVRQYMSAKQTWTLTDSTGEGVKVVNNTLKTLIIVSTIDQAITLASPGQRFTIPGHSVVLFNDPPVDGRLDFGSGWVTYYGSYSQMLPDVHSPTLVQLSRNSEGIDGGLPQIDEGTIIGSSLKLSNQ